MTAHAVRGVRQNSAAAHRPAQFLAALETWKIKSSTCRKVSIGPSHSVPTIRPSV